MSETAEQRRDGLLRLAVIWELLCPLCGEEFTSLRVLTRDHIISRHSARERQLRILDNLWPTHPYCNNLKSSGSMIGAMKRLDRYRKRVGEEHFRLVVNRQQDLPPLPEPPRPPTPVLTVTLFDLVHRSKSR